MAVMEELVVRGRYLRPGGEFSIKDGKHVRRFRFLSYDPRGWVNAWGGAPNQEMLRALRPEAIRTVHTTRKVTGIRR